MYRGMQPADLNGLKKLWAEVLGDTPDFAQTAIEQFAGQNNTYLAEENGVPTAVLLAVPVTLRGRRGSYLYGLAAKKEARESGVAAGLVDFVCAQQLLRGCGFAVAAPAGAAQFDFFAQRGFQKAFGLRRVHRDIKRNLWAQAEFDAVTAKKLCELRERFCPDAVMLTPKQMMVVLGDLYSRGITIVSSENGYGLYFRKDETLHFIEIQAESDRDAEMLLEAAREKEVVVENAELSVGAAQSLFLGEGVRMDYGMVRFDAEPFDVSEGYMRLMLEG